MDKKGISIYLGIIVALILIGLISFAAYQEHNKMQEYKNFCDENPTICYCKHSNCEFKTQWNSQEGFSNETIELCEIAKRLDDKRVIFKIGCE